METKLFGELFKELRQARGYTLREYCRTYEKDPGNMSKIERGLLPPPTKENELVSLALSVGLKENTAEWDEFISIATISAGRIPKEVMTDEEVLRHLPVLFRTITGEKLSKEKMVKLVEVIKRS